MGILLISVNTGFATPKHNSCSFSINGYNLVTANKWENLPKSTMLTPKMVEVCNFGNKLGVIIATYKTPADVSQAYKVEKASLDGIFLGIPAIIYPSKSFTKIKNDKIIYRGNVQADDCGYPDGDRNCLTGKGIFWSNKNQIISISNLYPNGKYTFNDLIAIKKKLRP